MTEKNRTENQAKWVKAEAMEVLQSRVINALRFPLIAGVLLIHTRVRPPDGSDGFFYYFEALFSRVLAHAAVPLFFFISGHLFFFSKPKKWEKENDKKNDYEECRAAKQGRGGSVFFSPPFTFEVWCKKLRRRARTLLLPYVLWIGGWGALYTALVAAGIIGTSRSLNATFYLHALWDIEGDAEGTRPLVGQFWFLRDLMCMVLLAPVLRFFIARRATLGLAFVTMLGFLWFFDTSQSPFVTRIPILGDRGLSHWALFFFSLGAWFSVHGKNFLVTFSKWRFLAFAIYPLLVIADLASLHFFEWNFGFSEWNFAIHRMGILAALPFFTLLAARVCSADMRPHTPASAPASIPTPVSAPAFIPAPTFVPTPTSESELTSASTSVPPHSPTPTPTPTHAPVSAPTSAPTPALAHEVSPSAKKTSTLFSFLTSASFFIYAAHGPALLFFLERFFLRPLNPHTDFTLTLCYMALFAVELIFCLALYALLRHFCPRFLSLLTGGQR